MLGVVRNYRGGRLLQKLRPFLCRPREDSIKGCSKFLSQDYSCSSEDYTPQYKRLDGKVAVITGAASGIGAATTKLFVAHGAYVVMADVQEEAGKRLSQELGDSAEFVHCDVSKDEDVAVAVRKASSAKGRIDILFSNARILGTFGAIDEINMKEFENTMAVNLRGSLLAIKHAASVMKAQKTGSIICTGSSAAILGGCAPHAYTISKAAMVGLIKSAAAELRSYGIRVNMVSPHATLTPLMKNNLNAFATSLLSDSEIENILRSMSLLPDRILAPIDIARAVLFLASNESGYVSGHNLVVDASQTVTADPAQKQFY